jgi:DNA-binding MarR family transcriptional regulator
MATKTVSTARATLLEQLAVVGREHSDATVLFHATVAGLMDLHPTDYKALGILDRLGPMSAGELARHTGLAAASVTNLVDRLEAKGFARRIGDVRDRRRVLVQAVRERLRGGRELFASTRLSLARLFERYTDGELAIIADFLTRNGNRLRAETARLPGRRPSTAT